MPSTPTRHPTRGFLQVSTATRRTISCPPTPEPVSTGSPERASPERAQQDPPLGTAARRLEERLPWEPEILLVLGSGLGFLADEVSDPVAIEFEAIPGLPRAGVAGHGGRLVAGWLEGCRVLVQAGRAHLYEGHPPAAVVATVRVAAELGVERLLLTNASGGIADRLVPGDLVLLDDHVDLMGGSPLPGSVLPGEPRFPDMSAPYDRELQQSLLDTAREARIRLKRGVYAGMKGPAYETPAEVRMLRTMGADVVGMSTVPEVIAARSRGMRVAAVSLVSNLAAGISPEPLSHAEVLAAARDAAPRFEALVRGFLARMR